MSVQTALGDLSEPITPARELITHDTEPSSPSAPAAACASSRSAPWSPRSPQLHPDASTGCADFTDTLELSASRASWTSGSHTPTPARSQVRCGGAVRMQAIRTDGADTYRRWRRGGEIRSQIRHSLDEVGVTAPYDGSNLYQETDQ